MKLSPAELLKKDHPFFSPDYCINRKQRRVVCSRCSELCPTGVFSLKSGERINWDRCIDCGVCVANCPTRCFAFSRTSQKRLSEEIDLQKTLVFSCRKTEEDADIRVRCLAALPWELLAVCAMHTGIAFRIDPCETCEESDRKACVQQNLDTLLEFLGDRYREHVRILHGKETPEPGEKEAADPGDRQMTRRGLFGGVKRSVAGAILHAAAERLPFLEETEEDGMLYRRQLASAVQKGTAKDQNLRFRVSLPQFTIRCTACGICEKICPQKAIRIVPEEDGNHLICLTPWKCTDCALCIRLCLKGGLSGMHPVDVPRLTELALVRIRQERTAAEHS